MKRDSENIVDSIIEQFPDIFAILYYDVISKKYGCNYLKIHIAENNKKENDESIKKNNKQYIIERRQQFVLDLLETLYHGQLFLAHKGELEYEDIHALRNAKPREIVKFVTKPEIFCFEDLSDLLTFASILLTLSGDFSLFDKKNNFLLQVRKEKYSHVFYLKNNFKAEELFDKLSKKLQFTISKNK